MANLRAELKSDLEKAGLLAYHPGQTYAKFLFLLTVTVGLLGGAFLAPSWFAKVPLFVAGVAASIGLVMLGHDSGHFAVSKNRLVNDFIGFFCFSFFAGFSLTYWRYKHNTLHHSYVNVDGKDPDITIFPFAMHKDQRAETGFRGWVQRHQGLFFWPLATFTGFAMRYDAFKFIFTKGRKVVAKRDLMVDLTVLILHFVAALALPVALGAPVAVVLASYAAWTVIAGVMLAAIFLPAHMTLPLYKDYEDNFVLQLQATQNLRTNPLFSFLLIGLDHQVEHHLFQKMSHLEVKKAAPIVKAFCERHGLPYYSVDWGKELWEVTKRLDTLPDYELVDLPERLFPKAHGEAKAA